MSRCNNCNIEILDETTRCPLCHSVLTHTDDLENMYPDARVKMRRMMLATRIFLFCAIITEAIVVCLTLFIETEYNWAVITGLTLLCVYMTLRYAIAGESDYKSKVLFMALLLILAAVAIDYASGYRGWAVEYVLPGIILVIDLIILFCMFYNRQNWQSYILWQIFMILCSLIPVGLYLAGFERYPHLAVLPLAISSAIFLGTMIIGDRRARIELKRRFHIK